MSKPRIAIVVQRYGEAVSGGAELQARWLAEHLLSIAQVHVVTTCALDHHTWANHYEPGESHLNGVHVHRFTVDTARQWPAFKKLTGRILNEPPSLFAQLEWLKQQGPLSTSLLTFLESSYRQFEAYIFFTYMYATTFFGLPLVANRAILVPEAHEDPFLALPIFRQLFHLPHTIAYNTETEKNLVNRVTRNGYRHGDAVVGVGINVPQETSAQRFRQRYGIDDDFILYVGRIDESKNVPGLLNYYRRYRAQTKRPPSLVLIGKPSIDLPQHPHIHALGFLSEEDKFDAIRAAQAVVVPSFYESLSMSALEAWLMETPVLANGACQVLKDQCRASNGGLYFHSYDEFEATLSLLLDKPHLAAQLGRNGCRFVSQTYSWSVITDKYSKILDDMAA